jgi:DNA-binding transcriptional LysR family regulator
LRRWQLRPRSVIVDGEQVACDDTGVPDFERLRYSNHDDRVVLCAFDLIELDAEDLRREPWVTRKATMGPALGRRMLLRAIPSFQKQYPDARLVLLGINDPAEVGAEGIDVLIRPRSARRSGTEHRPQQGLVVRKLVESPILICASPDYLKRAGIPRAPADLANHSCLALLTMERDFQDEWQFAKGGRREKIKFAPKVAAYGEELREAALAGCGIVRLLACHVESELQSGALVQLP